MVAAFKGRFTSGHRPKKAVIFEGGPHRGKAGEKVLARKGK